MNWLFPDQITCILQYVLSFNVMAELLNCKTFKALKVLFFSLKWYIMLFTCYLKRIWTFRIVINQGLFGEHSCLPDVGGKVICRSSSMMKHTLGRRCALLSMFPPYWWWCVNGLCGFLFFFFFGQYCECIICRKRKMCIISLMCYVNIFSFRWKA